jgi:hypothetical protein
MSEQPTPERVLQSIEVSDVDTRAKRIDKLKELTAERFEGEQYKDLRAKVEQSFDVPQAGEYHNEGATMDAHLGLILENIEAIAEQGAKALPEHLPENVRDQIAKTIKNQREKIEQYVLVHDIAKADTLGITVGDGEEQAMTWEEWQAFVSAADDKDNLGVTKVSYKKHAKKGSAQIQELGFDDPLIRLAVEKHMIAISMTEINSEVYERHFAGLDQEQADFATTANYLDLAGSKKVDGKDGFKEFDLFLASKEKSETIRSIVVQLADGAVTAEEVRLAIAKMTAGGKGEHKDDLWLQVMGKISKKGFVKGKLTNVLAKLRSSDKPLTAEGISVTMELIKKECELVTYDPDKVRALGETLFDDPADVQLLVTVATTDPGAIGRTFAKKLGKRMGQLMVD